MNEKTTDTSYKQIEKVANNENEFPDIDSFPQFGDDFNKNEINLSPVSMIAQSSEEKPRNHYLTQTPVSRVLFSETKKNILKPHLKNDFPYPIHFNSPGFSPISSLDKKGKFYISS